MAPWLRQRVGSPERTICHTTLHSFTGSVGDPSCECLKGLQSLHSITSTCIDPVQHKNGRWQDCWGHNMRKQGASYIQIMWWSQSQNPLVSHICSALVGTGACATWVNPCDYLRYFCWFWHPVAHQGPWDFYCGKVLQRSKILTTWHTAYLYFLFIVSVIYSHA